MTIEATRLRELLPSATLLPDDPGFAAACVSFNGMLQRRPAAIVSCATTDDVVAAVRGARAAGLPVAVRGGGHSVAGLSLADDAVVVSLDRMRRVEVDPEARLARAQGGALWEDVDGATVPHDLFTPGGTFVDTGIGGLTLSGGIGFLMSTGGLTCDNLVGAEVVTADGSIVVAGEGGDPELLWALRGGGGNFGVVTEFTFALHRLGPIHVGAFAVPIADAAEGLRRVAALARSDVPGVTCLVVGPTTRERTTDLVRAEDKTFLRLFGVFHGGPADAEAAFAPLRSLPSLSGGIGPITYPELQAISGIMPFGLRNYWKGHFVRDLDEPAIAAVLHGLATAPGDVSFLLLESISGRARTEPAGGASFGQRAARWNVSALAIWEDPAEDELQIGWAREIAARLEPSSLTGAGYGNYAPPDETTDRQRASWDDERYERLRQVKRRHDPDNVFRFNHNIPPAEDD